MDSSSSVLVCKNYECDIVRDPFLPFSQRVRSPMLGMDPGVGGGGVNQFVDICLFNYNDIYWTLECFKKNLSNRLTNELFKFKCTFSKTPFKHGYF